MSMLFKVFSPPIELKSYVHSIQIMEVDKNENSTQNKIVPYGYAGLLLHYKDPCLQTDRTNGKRLLPQVFITGLIDQPIIIEALGNIGTIAVNFYPLGLYHFLRSAVYEFTNLTVDGTELLGPEINKLLTSIMLTSSIYEKIDLVNRFLIKKLGNIDYRNSIKIEYAQNALIASKGIINIALLSKESGLSLSSLERQFRKQIGFSPKYYARILRFDYVFKLKQMQGYVNWQDIVFQGGYHDQAHFIKEFSKFAGEPPRSFFHHHLFSSRFYSGK